MIVRNLQREARRLAFTLMEMLIVVAIIVMLAGMGGYYVLQRYEESKVSNAVVGAQKISSAVQFFKIDHNRFPNTLEELIQKTDGMGPYLANTNELLDPWGKEYGYDPAGQRNANAGALTVIPDVFTTTPDGREVGNYGNKK